MANKALNARMLYYLFSSANMHRWNDHLRTLDLTELDKQAHKAAIAWALGKAEEDAGNEVDWHVLIEHMLFSFMQRVALTDLKPQIFHRIVKEKSDDVSRYALEQFDQNIPETNLDFRDRYESYLFSVKDSEEDEIVSAAHYLATKWEFNIIYGVNSPICGIDDTKKDIDDRIEKYASLVAVKEITTPGSNLYEFVDAVGRLRFQQRWARTPRIPKTTVLGHSLLVADTVYLNDCDKGVRGERVYNDFFTALFHDLPEVLTKDVISPVKTSVNGLLAILEKMERELVEEKIMPLIPEKWRPELRSMACDPFTNHPARDGQAIKACDWLAAWVEAHVSIVYGISSKALRDGKVDVCKKLTVAGCGDTIGASDILFDF